jgi:hypothetical protein
MNWDTLKDEIRTFWMNQSWIERTQRQATRARYREPGHAEESPSEYNIRKYELISLVYNFTPSQVMAEVIRKAPVMWGTVLNPRSFDTLAQFQTAFKYHEELLIDLGNKFKDGISSSRRARTYRIESSTPPRSNNPFRRAPPNRKSIKPKTRSYAVGWDKHKPQFTRDDATVSIGNTPEFYGARGCILCSSLKHWDRNCKYNKDGTGRKVQAMFAELTPEALHAEAEYEQCYADSTSSNTSLSDIPEVESEEDSGE